MTEPEKDFDKNSWQTPKYVFDWLNNRFNFVLDGCATKENSLISMPYGYGPFFIGKGSHIAEDFLCDELQTLLQANGFLFGSIFVNPPYSDVTPFLKRAKALRDAGYLVVMLLNNDKSTQWYQQCVHNVANEVIDIVGGRINFIHPVTGEEIKGNSKGQMVVVFDPAMDDFVQRSVSLDFVKKCGGK